MAPNQWSGSHQVSLFPAMQFNDFNNLLKRVVMVHHIDHEVLSYVLVHYEGVPVVPQKLKEDRKAVRLLALWNA
jgi:hypothetical protein